jgi:hypothetical protein
VYFSEFLKSETSGFDRAGSPEILFNEHSISTDPKLGVIRTDMFQFKRYTTINESSTTPDVV